MIPPVFDQPITFFSVLKAALGGLLIFFLPGFLWSLFLFSTISWLERVPVSIGISLAITSVAGIVLSMLFHFPLNGTNTIIANIILTAIPFGLWIAKKHRLRHSDNSKSG